MRHAVSASEPNTPREFLSKKNCHFLVVERCVKVFSIRSTVHDMTCTWLFFFPSNTQLFRFKVDKGSTYHYQQYHYTLPEKRVWFFLSPQKMVGPFTPKKDPTQNSDKNPRSYQECCLPPASPSGGLDECFDALFTRDPFEKMIWMFPKIVVPPNHPF